MEYCTETFDLHLLRRVAPMIHPQTPEPGPSGGNETLLRMGRNTGA
jgi:hypothetical protein